MCLNMCWTFTPEKVKLSLVLYFFTLISTFTTGSEPSDHAVPFSINKLSFLQLTSFNMIYYICIESLHGLHGFLICVYIKRLQWFKVCPFRLRILNFSLFYSHEFLFSNMCFHSRSIWQTSWKATHMLLSQTINYITRNSQDITSQETHKT